MGTNSGRYSKFQERLKKIVRNRLKHKKKDEEEQLTLQELHKQFISNKVDEIHTVIFKDSFEKKNVNVKNVYVTRKNGKNKEDLFSSMVKAQDTTTFLNLENNCIPKADKKVKSKNEDLEVLGVELINKIKTSFEDKLDMLEVMESELYLLSVEQKDVLEIKKLEEIKKRINELIDKINEIVSEYNLYNKNYYMDNFIGIEDKIIEANIINYRELLDSSDKEKEFVKEYKMLEEFEKLYSNLVVIKHDTEKIISENEEKTQEFDIRDTKHKYVVEEIVKINDVQKFCLEKIDSQSKYLEDLASKVNVIERKEYITTHLKGLGELVGQSLKFMGLKILSPLSGLLPSVAVNTLMTKKLIGDIYNNLHYEDVKHVYYSAINYDSELASKITDIGYTEDLIESTLIDIKKLKEDFMLQYDSRIPGFDDTLKKINDIEIIVYRNQNKVNILKSKLIKNKKINEDKIIKVKKLNEKKN